MAQELTRFQQWYKSRQVQGTNELDRARFNARRRTNRRLLEFVDKIDDKKAERQFTQQQNAGAAVPQNAQSNPTTPAPDTPVDDSDLDLDADTAPVVTNPADTVSVAPVGSTNTTANTEGA